MSGRELRTAAGPTDRHVIDDSTHLVHSYYRRRR